MDDAEVQILINWREAGREILAEARAGAERMKDAVNSLNRSMAEGVPVAKAMNNVLQDQMEQMILSGATIQAAKDSVVDLRHALESYVDRVVFEGMPAQAAFDAILADQIAMLQAATEATDEDTAATQANNAAKASGGIGAIAGIGFMPALIGGIAAAAIVFAPFVALVLNAAVALTSFAVAGGAAVAVVTALGVGFFGLGAVLGILSIHFGTMKAVNAEWNGFVGHLQRMAKVIGDAAGPAIHTLIRFFDFLIPSATQAGVAIAKWFSGELPSVLAETGQIIRDLTPDFQQFGTFLAQAFDAGKVGSVTIIEGLIRNLLRAVEGLITNLIRLKDWFIKELPTLGPIVQQIFSGIGNAIQGLGGHWSDLNNFVTKTWPQTVNNAVSLAKQLQSWWAQNGSIVLTFAGNLVQLMNAINKLLAPMMALYNLLNGVGLTPTAILGALDSIYTFLKNGADEAERLWSFLQKIMGSGSQVPSGGNLRLSRSAQMSALTSQ